MNLFRDTDDRLAERNDLFLRLARDQSDWDLAGEVFCYQLIHEILMKGPSDEHSVAHRRAF